MANRRDSCCAPALGSANPDHSKELNRVNRIRGQLDGIAGMIKDGRYCPEIIVQVKATRAALRGLQTVLLEKHLEVCVRDAFESKDKRLRDEKIRELLELFGKA